MSKNESIDALIFIDTNIYLDFYRIRRSNISMKYVEKIESHKNRIITSSQVEMEFKKNRQIAILESIAEIKKINNVPLSIPAILSDVKAVEMVKKSKAEITKQQKKIKIRIERILKNPIKYDPVYKSLQRLFKTKSDVNLRRNDEARLEIRELAKKRFSLGYPPRKKTDNSFGDAINWEWIIKCAEKTGKHIIIVTRDSDFGISYDSETYLNDWLGQEFKERVDRKRKILITDKLSKAFQLTKIKVTKEMIKEEERLVELDISKVLARYGFAGINKSTLDILDKWKLLETDNIFPQFNLPDFSSNIQEEK